MTFLLFLVALATLVIGAEMLVRGASSLGESLGLSPVVIGLIIVGFGTSTPELSVGVMSSLNGQTEIAIGSTVGSNIFNLLIILGLAAVVTPLQVQNQLVRMDVPVMIGVTVAAAAFALDGRFTRIEGACCLLGLSVYTTVLLRMAAGEKDQRQNLTENLQKASQVLPRIKMFLLAAVGLGTLIGGSSLLVENAIIIARRIGVSETIIGLTIVAAGTSLPELVTSIIASIKGQRDLAVGNVVGSNVFNVLGVLGASAIVSAEGLAAPANVVRFDFPIAIVAALICWPIFATGRKVSRAEGCLLLAGYGAYITVLVF